MSANNGNTDSPDGPLGSDIDRFARYLMLERGRSANTLAAYRNDLAAYNQWLAERGIDDLSEVTSDHIELYATSQTGSPRSVQRRLSAIRSFHSYLVESGSQTTNPASTVMGPVQPQRLPKALSVDTVIRLLDSVAADDPVSLRDRALLEVLYGTGARVSEVVGLAVDDVVDTSGSSPDILRVIGKGDKERIVPLGSHAKAALDAYLVRSRPVLTRKASRATPALFVGVRGRPLSRQSAWLVLRDRAEAAGVTETLSPHTLRHSCATHLIAGGADIRVVQELLGHQSVQTTQIYTKVTIDSLRDVYYTSHPRARS